MPLPTLHNDDTMRTENLAIMFTDMSGFTARTSEQTREENELMLELHEALLLPVLRAFNGKRVKSIGDAFLVTFHSPTDAVLCGMAIQDRLHDYNRDVPEKLRIEVRVAINLGEVRIVRGDVFGEPVNIASRVEGIAPPGEIYLTESVYLAMNKREAPATDIGPQSLKGIPEPVRVFKVPRVTQAGHESANDFPYGGRELARVKETGAKLHLARELALTIGGSLERGGEALQYAGGSMRGLVGSARRSLSHFIHRFTTGFRALPRHYASLENRRGRWRVRGVITGLVALLVVGAIAVYQALHFDPYAEARNLVRQGAYPTALARLDGLSRNRYYTAQGEYWFWRGRAQIGRGNLDAALDAYKEAIARDPSWRSNHDVINDVVQALSRHHSQRAQKLILTELGPNAQAPLLAETEQPLASARWLAVETIEALGGKERIDYSKVALADFAAETTCPKRKLAVQKLGEYEVREALPALDALKDAPEYKCLQATLSATLTRLRASH